MAVLIAIEQRREVRQKSTRHSQSGAGAGRSWRSAELGRDRRRACRLTVVRCIHVYFPSLRSIHDEN